MIKLHGKPVKLNDQVYDHRYDWGFVAELAECSSWPIGVHFYGKKGTIYYDSRGRENSSSGRTLEWSAPVKEAEEEEVTLESLKSEVENLKNEVEDLKLTINNLTRR